MIGYPESWSVKSDVYACLRFVEIVKSVVSLDKAVVAIKGLKKFPVAGERQYGTIDVYWIM